MTEAFKGEKTKDTEKEITETIYSSSWNGTAGISLVKTATFYQWKY